MLEGAMNMPVQVVSTIEVVLKTRDRIVGEYHESPVILNFLVFLHILEHLPQGSRSVNIVVP